MIDWVKDVATTWLGLVLLFGAAAAVLAVDIGREVVTDSERRHRWLTVAAFVVVPVLVVAAAGATVIRIFSLA